MLQAAREFYAEQRSKVYVHRRVSAEIRPIFLATGVALGVQQADSVPSMEQEQRARRLTEISDAKWSQSVTAIQAGDMPSVIGESEAAARDPLPDMENSARSPESRSAT